MKEHIIFAAKVALAILVINQIGPLKGLVYRDYFGTGTSA